ncbi:hypothetical protein WR25_23982 isoform B [Diploscapter pachys]|uniref:Abnormal cell migration protein 18-like fibronectin type I domain-containing protein n=1 Tax=Diploscapter pachys TaxID=2018661 RepID=A0A2A2L076_9BILA|nr:hypothetical protein WR25_23982 isoform B [Diploscapter pachys]
MSAKKGEKRKMTKERSDRREEGKDQLSNATKREMNIAEGDFISGSDGYLQFEYSGCVAPDGNVYGPEETWTDKLDTYYFKCQQNGKFLKMEAEGCVSHDKQRRIPLGDTDDNGEYIYKCTQKSSGAISLCSVGCIHDGIHYATGEQWQDGAYLFYCKSVNGKCTKQVIGCVEGGKKLFDGQKYRRDGTVFQCEVRRNRRSHKVIGCVAEENGKMVDKVIGCRWYLHTENSKIEQTCVRDGTGTRVVTVGCIYRYQGFDYQQDKLVKRIFQGYDRIFLEPGMYTVWNLPKQYKEAIGLACRPTENGARLDVFDVNNLVAETNGLTYDTPKGK